QPANQSVLEDQGNPHTVNLTGISAGPTNESGQSISITASSSNTALIGAPTITYTSPNATGTLQFASATDANGTATISVTVQDNGGTANSGTDTTVTTFVVTVNAVNDQPTLTQPGNQSV